MTIHAGPGAAGRRRRVCNFTCADALLLQSALLMIRRRHRDIRHAARYYRRRQQTRQWVNGWLALLTMARSRTLRCLLEGASRLPLAVKLMPHVSVPHPGTPHALSSPGQQIMLPHPIAPALSTRCVVARRMTEGSSRTTTHNTRSTGLETQRMASFCIGSQLRIANVEPQISDNMA